jgi:signal transduction histidine kinase
MKLATRSPIIEENTLLGNLCLDLAQQFNLSGIWVGVPEAQLRRASLTGLTRLETLLDWLPEMHRRQVAHGRDLVVGSDLDLPADLWTHGNGRSPAARKLCWAALPLLLEGFQAALLLMAREGPFEGNDFTRLETTTSLMAAWIERNLYYQIANQYRSSLEALHTVSLNMSSTLDLIEILQLLAESTLQLIPASAVHIYIHQPEAVITPVFAFGASLGSVSPQQADPTAAAPEALIQQIAQHKWPLVIDAVSAHPLAEQLAAAGWQVASLTGYPLSRGGRLLGVYIISFLEPYRLSQDERYLISHLTDQAVVAIDNARVTRNLSHRLAEVKALQGLAQRVSATQDLEAVLQNTVRELKDLFDASAAAIMLLDDSQALQQAAVAGDPQCLPDPAYLAPGQGLAGRVILSGQTVHLPDLRQADADLLQGGCDEPPSPRSGSLLVMPLQVQGRLIGALTIVSQQTNAFGPDAERLLTIAIAQAAIAFQSTRLYQEETRRNDELAAFTENISHELRNPLTLLKAYVELLLEGEMGRLSQKQRQAISIIQSKITSMSRLVEDITLLQSRGRDWLDLQTINFRIVAQTSVILAERLASKRGIMIELESPAELPVVQADPDRLAQALDNLLNDAIKLAQPQSKITLHLNANPDHLLVSIYNLSDLTADSTQELVRDRIFKASQDQGNLGLGLAVVRRIIEAHGGKVWMESQPGAGAAFYFTLPYQQAG